MVLRRFIADEQGSITIEVLVWFIMMLGIVGIIVDASVILHSHSQVLRTLQDGNRNLSVGRLKTTQDVQLFVTTQLAGLSDKVTTKASIADVPGTIYSGDRIVTTVVSLPTADLPLIGFYAVLNTAEIKVSAQHYIEDYGL